MTDAGIFKLYGTDYTVLLSMDGVYKNGKYIVSETQRVLPNAYVIDISRMDDRVMFGASVHPYRDAGEMLSETKRCVSEGAVLFNWMPSVQQIDPEDDRCIPFYLCLVRQDIPLLCLSGPGGIGNHLKFNHPGKLARALDISVKVVVTFSLISDYEYDDRYYGDHFNELIGMLRSSEQRKWELYADISAFCVPAGIKYLEAIQKEIESGRVGQNRFLYGSDITTLFTDPCTNEIRLNRNNIPELLRIRGSKLDNNHYMLKKSGIHDSILYNAGDVLGLQNRRDLSCRLGQR